MEKNKVLLKSYRETEEYNALVDECVGTFKERLFNSRTELILAYGQLGERIFNDSLYKKYGKGSQSFIKDLAKDTELGHATIYRAVQFYEKYKVVSPTSESWKHFKEGKNISWNKIKILYLPKLPKPKKGASGCQHVLEFWAVCKICGANHRIKRSELRSPKEIENKFK